MKRQGVLVLLVAMILGGFLFGCMGPMTPPPDTTPVVVVPTDYSLYGTANFSPPNPEENPYPLFVGARWIYRNAAAYWNPQISASGLLESEVVAVVQGDDEHCYVLETRYSNGPGELLYLHRASNTVALRGSRVVASPGSQTAFALNPGLALLHLPLAEDKVWELPFSEGTVTAHVYHQEVVAIESGEVRTLLETHTPIFRAWRVHYELFGTGPRFFGGPQQYLWFAPGVGVVKHVLNSVDYELAEFRLPEEVVLLEEKDAGRTVRVPSGRLVIVQLRGGDPNKTEGWAWRSLEADGDEGAVEEVSDGFYLDAPRVAKRTGAGSYVYRFRAQEPGETTLRFEFFSLKTGVPEPVVEYTIRVE